MLSNEDLQKITEIVEYILEKKVRKIIQEEVPGMIKKAIEPLRSDISVLQRDVRVLQKEVRKFKKDLITITDYFDRRQIEQDKRITRIELNLRLNPIR